jgi:hypothetical protein
MVHISKAVSGQVMRLKESLQGISRAMAGLYVDDVLRLDVVEGLIAQDAVKQDHSISQK